MLEMSEDLVMCRDKMRTYLDLLGVCSLVYIAQANLAQWL